MVSDLSCSAVVYGSSVTVDQVMVAVVKIISVDISQVSASQ